MTTFFYIFLGLLSAIILFALMWHFVAKSFPCPTWLGWLVELDNPFTKINRAQTIIEHLDVHAGMRVLDAGCGPGRLTIPLAKKVGENGEVVALDIQAGMLEKVRLKAQKENLTNILYLNAGLGEGKLSANTFDRIILITVLGEIPNQRSALVELCAALKSGGLLLITELIFDPHFQKQAKVESLVQSVGFHIKQIAGNRFAYILVCEKK